MSVNQNTYDNPAWGRPAASGAWPGAEPRGFDGGPLAGARAFLDGLPRPVALALMVGAFIFWWPIGLATLFYMIGSGRLGARWRRDRMPGGVGAGWTGWAMGAHARQASTGNHAFDEYREHTLKRLEEEQQEFGAFLERLRFAKDKAEFDQFMAERRGRPPAAPSEGDQQAA